MNSFEKYEKMLSMQPYNDRTEMPVFPMMLATYGSLGGVSQKEICADPDKWILSVENTIAKIGKPDVSMAMCPGDTIFVMGLPARLPGRELKDDDLYQFVETAYFDDPSEYDRIMGMTWQYWYGEYMMKIQNPPLTDPQQLMQRYGIMGANMGKTIGYFISKGIVPCMESACGPIFDTLSMIRTMAEFTYDLYDEPEKIIDIMRKYQPEEDARTIGMMKATGGRKLGIFAMRSSATFISPSMFEEIVWPTLKQSILSYHEAGLLSILHADGNWLPMLKYFTELPKGCVHIELDGSTDIHQAYEILHGCQTLRGDVPATMLAYGTPEEVSAYCEDLIQMGMKGGFMLSSGCEVPLNAKLENVKAMMDSVK